MSTTARSAKESREAAARVAARRTVPDDAPVPEPTRLESPAVPAGPSGARFVLELLRRREAPNQLFEAAARAHGPVAHFRMAGDDVYLLSDPDLITDVFLTHARDVMKGRGLQATRPLLGNGLLTSEGEFHLRQRRLAQPGFHRQRIEAYAAQMVSEAERHSAAWSDGRQVEMVDEMTSLTFAIVGRTLFDSDLTGDAKTFGDTLEELMAGFGQLSALGNERIVRALPQGRRLLAKVDDLDAVVQRMISEHRADLARGVERPDLLTWMIEAHDAEGAERYGETMTDEQLRDEVMTMVLAGHETTAMALSWTWWLLSSNPAAYDRLVAELDAVLADPAEGTRAPGIRRPAGAAVHPRRGRGDDPALPARVDHGSAHAHRPARRRLGRPVRLDRARVPLDHAPRPEVLGPLDLVRAGALARRRRRVRRVRAGPAARRLDPVRLRQPALHRRAVRVDRGGAARRHAGERGGGPSSCPARRWPCRPRSPCAPSTACR